jgi:hypothetical protein
MPMPAADNPDAVIDAGRRLRAAGKTVTANALRTAMGNVGNRERLWTIWTDYLAEAEPPPAAPRLPSEVEADVNNVRAQIGAAFDAAAIVIWQAAERGAAARAAVEVEQARAEVARIQAALDQQTAERLDAEAAANKAEEQAVALREQLEAERLKTTRAEAEATVARGEFARIQAELTTAAAERARAEERAKGLEQRLADHLRR